MSDNNLEISNYAIYKQLFAQMEPLSGEKLDKKLQLVEKWFKKKASKYYTLMCREIYDFTTFCFTKSIYKKGAKELNELLKSRGKILSIDYIDIEDAFECWIKHKDGEVRMYYLFSSDWMMLEIE